MTNKERLELMSEIADRAIGLAMSCNVKIEKIDMMLDLEFADKCCPLKLAELASAPVADFSHDVFGIRRHLNRQTKQLEDCFLPRFAA